MNILIAALIIAWALERATTRIVEAIDKVGVENEQTYGEPD